jgi:hypothetical protein
MTTPAHGRRLVYSPRTLDLDEFADLAARAKDAGFTHIFISDLAEATDCFGADAQSPWCAWSNVLPSIFKHATPPGLEDAFPADFVQRQMDFMRAKHSIVEKLDLQAAYYGVEPNWLRDEVYHRKPRWRGSRADNSLRTTGMYFAPNTDHPEVRAAYRHAVREITRQCPRLTFYNFVTNDSGAFYPWEKRLYANVNGPTGYAGRDMGERVVGFLSAIREGAAEAGADAFVSTDLYGRFVDDEIHTVLKSLKPGIGVTGRVPGPLASECAVGHCGGWGGGPWMPHPVIDRMPAPFSVVSGAAAIRNGPAGWLMAGGNSPEYFEALKIALSCPPAGNTRERMAVLARIAEGLYGSAAADAVLDGWYTLDRAEALMNCTGVKPMGGPVIMRWLTRPLVAHQERLTAEERAYWEPLIYQSIPTQPDTYLNYLNQSGYRMAHTWEEASHTCIAIDTIEATLAAAADRLDDAATRAAGPAAQRLTNDALRVRALRCLTLTVRHFLQVGTLIDQRDAANAAQPLTATTGGDLPAMPQGDAGSNGLWFMYRALRWELDNTYDLIELMERATEPLFFTCEAKKGPLFLEADLLPHVRRKAEIMLRHWRDAEIGYYRPTKGG